MKKMIHVFWLSSVFVLFVSITASADFTKDEYWWMKVPMERHCKDLALQQAQTSFDVTTEVTHSSLQPTTCSYNPFSSCEFAVRCEYLLTTYSPGSTNASHKGYLTLKVYRSEKNALKNNKSFDVHPLFGESRNGYIAHSIPVLELFFID